MFYQINEIIDINLQRLFISKNQSLKFSEFKDKNGKKLKEMIEFFQIMEKEKLIKIENNKCILTEFGKNIAENGGWFEHLKKTEENKIETTATESNLSKKSKKRLKKFSINKISLKNHFKNILKKINKI